jgi:pyruvate formate lyase activating enzyme
MKIGGLQKFSLVDYPGKIAAIIFTQGCNFRCPYCHNPELVDPARMSQPLDNDKVLAFLKTRKNKLDAVCITGGEPTIQEDLPAFLREIKAMGFAIKLDTNGSQPHALADLLSAKLLDFVAMDIKAPLERYEWVCQANCEAAIISRSMELLRAYQMEREFRSTIVHPLLSLPDVENMMSLLQKGERYYLQKYKAKNILQGQAKQFAPFSSMLLHALAQKAIQKGIHLAIR